VSEQPQSGENAPQAKEASKTSNTQ
jgi:hypothetical protein